MFRTYFGNSNTNLYGINEDSYEDSYITGQTNSNSFPVKNAFQSTLGGIFNAFVAKFNATGSLVFSTYLGGNGQDNGDGITVDNNGNSYITGATSSTNFPLKNAYSTTYNSNLYRIFVTKLNATGNGLIFSTYFGGNAFNAGDIGSGIAIENNNICITGSTTSPDFPLKNPLQSTLNGPHDPLLTIFNTTGNRLIFST